MSRIDEIKKHTSEGYYTCDDDFGQCADFTDDIQYLLSKIEEATKTFAVLELHARGRRDRDIGYETVENICDKAIQQMRE